MTDRSHETPDEAAVGAAMAVMDRFMDALNGGDEAALQATLHFPHYRLAVGGMQVFPRPEDYTLAAFLARAGDGWSHSGWDFRRVIAAGSRKVHLDVQFTRYRKDGTALGHFRSLYVLTQQEGRWGIALRSTFAG